MRIIKLSAINSTNSYLRKLYRAEFIADFTTVITDKQTDGRGQMGAVWNSQEDRNLTFSVFKDVSTFNLEYPFAISMVVALALRKGLEQLLIPQVYIKWPNDILSGNKKICGVLIENVIKQNQIAGSIIGIGLNVNQDDFTQLPKASSLKNITGLVYDLDELLKRILNSLEVYFGVLNTKNGFETIKEEYEFYLFRKNKPSTFKDVKGLMFSGIIQGVSNSGNLQVLLEDEIVKLYELKEVTLLY